MIRVRKRTLLIAGVGLLLIAAAIGCGLFSSAASGPGGGNTSGQAGEEGATNGGEGSGGSEGGADSGSGGSGGDTVPVVDDGRPAAPSDLGADHVAVWNVNVSWADNSDNEDGFRIYRQRLDLLGPLQMAGEAGEDATLYYDTQTLCGATYKYIVASYNEVGESPASACWVITLPPCTAEQHADMQIGPDYGYDFLAGGPANPGDFYLGFGADSQLMIMADQEGQNGVMDLGFLGDWPLNRVDPPPDGEWVKDGVPVVIGNTYVALARDGSSMIVFRPDELGSTVKVTAMVWYDVDLITSEACQGPPDETIFTGGGGNPCVSGDGVCDPTCSSPGPDVIGTPARDETGMLREVETLRVVERTDGGDDGDGGDTLIEMEPRPPEIQDCIDQAKALIEHDPPTPAEMVAAQAAFYECLDDKGIPHSTPRTPEREILIRDDGSSDIPTFTPRDYDCDDNACVPGDGVCDPTCRPVPDGYRPLRELVVDSSDSVDRTLIEIVPMDGGDGSVDVELTRTVDRGDLDCLPDRTFKHFCGPERPSILTDAFDLVHSEDRNSDGDDDYFVYIDSNPGSPTYGTVVEWDMLCRDPGRRYICSKEWPEGLTDSYEQVSAQDRNGDGVIDFTIWVNTYPDDPDYGKYIIWDTDCGDDELICSPRIPPQITNDYQPVGSEDTNNDGQADRITYVNVNPNSPDYGKKIIWDLLCNDPERKYWCGPNEPTWLSDDYVLVDSGATYKIYQNINPDAPDYGDYVYWDFGPNCPGGDTPPPPPPDPCAEHGGLGWEGDVCVCEGIIVHVTICQDQTQMEQRTEVPCTPDPQSCNPPDEPPPDDGGGQCQCVRTCAVWNYSVQPPVCQQYVSRDSCTGAVCQP